MTDYIPVHQECTLDPTLVNVLACLCSTYPGFTGYQSDQYHAMLFIYECCEFDNQVCHVCHVYKHFCVAGTYCCNLSQLTLHHYAVVSFRRRLYICEHKWTYSKGVDPLGGIVFWTSMVCTIKGSTYSVVDIFYTFNAFVERYVFFSDESYDRKDIEEHLHVSLTLNEALDECLYLLCAVLFVGEKATSFCCITLIYVCY